MRSATKRLAPYLPVTVSRARRNSERKCVAIRDQRVRSPTTARAIRAADTNVSGLRSVWRAQPSTENPTQAFGHAVRSVVSGRTRMLLHERSHRVLLDQKARLGTGVRLAFRHPADELSARIRWLDEQLRVA